LERRSPLTEGDSPLLRARDLLIRSGLPPLQVQDAGRGSHHHIFVVELDEGPMRLMRVPIHREDRAITPWLRSEEEAIRRASHTIAVPYPAILIPSADKPEGCIMPIIEGTRAQDLRGDESVSAAAGELCRLLAQSLARLHRIEFPIHEPTYIPFLSPEFLTGGERLLHGDAHLGNMMVEESDAGRWSVSAIVDWSFCHWGPPESDLVEMAITEAESRPVLGRIFYDSYLEAGGFEAREHVFKWALARELERRLSSHAQAYEQTPRDVWTRWLAALHRPGARALHIFRPDRTPGSDLV
jgi:aminoglycoside phosphotransferase (APT) family kinase protein